MKKNILILFIILMASSVSAQVLKLTECFRWVEENHPKTGQVALLNQQLEITLKQLDKNFLPHVNLEAQASYQSDVTKVDANIPGMSLDIPTPDKDQYRAAVNLSQTIYDGGVTKTQRQIEETGNRVGQKEVEVTVHRIKEQVTTAYFSILLLQQQKELLRSTKETLQSRYQQLQAAVEHGTALAADTNVMKVELVKLDNQLQHLERQKKTAFEVLSALTGEPIGTKRVLEVPQYNLTGREDFSLRPDMEMLSLQQQQAADYKALSKRKYYPKVQAFSSAGYGRPGLNMLSEEFDTYWTVGAAFTWDVWNWKKAKDEQSILSLRQNILEKEKESLALNLSVEQMRKKAEIADLKQQMDDDKKVLSLYKDIVASQASKLDNGTITSAEFIVQLNNQKEAQLQYELHQIQLEKAKADYNLISGNITFQEK